MNKLDCRDLYVVSVNDAHVINNRPFDREMFKENSFFPHHVHHHLTREHAVLLLEKYNRRTRPKRQGNEIDNKILIKINKEGQNHNKYYEGRAANLQQCIDSFSLPTWLTIKLS